MSHNLGVDVGGPLRTSLVFDEETNELTVDKVLSTPADPYEGVLQGIKEATAKADASVSDLNLLFHGTTVVTNMLLEETGSRVGLITSEGHEDVLHLARVWTPRPLHGWMGMEKRELLADLVDTHSAPGRINSPTGEVSAPPDEESVRTADRELREMGVEA